MHLAGDGNAADGPGVTLRVSNRPPGSVNQQSDGAQDFGGILFVEPGRRTGDLCAVGGCSRKVGLAFVGVQCQQSDRCRSNIYAEDYRQSPSLASDSTNSRRHYIVFVARIAWANTRTL